MMPKHFLLLVVFKGEGFDLNLFGSATGPLWNCTVTHEQVQQRNTQYDEVINILPVIIFPCYCARRRAGSCGGAWTQGSSGGKWKWRNSAARLSRMWTRSRSKLRFECIETEIKHMRKHINEQMHEQTQERTSARIAMRPQFFPPLFVLFVFKGEGFDLSHFG